MDFAGVTTFTCKQFSVCLKKSITFVVDLNHFNRQTIFCLSITICELMKMYYKQHFCTPFLGLWIYFVPAFAESESLVYGFGNYQSAITNNSDQS